MSNVIGISRSTRINRASGEVWRLPESSHYVVRIRFDLPMKKRDQKVVEFHAHLFARIQNLGGFKMTKGFKKGVVRGGGWHKLPYGPRLDLLKIFLEAVDETCETGMVEVMVNGKRMGRSERAKDKKSARSS